MQAATETRERSKARDLGACGEPAAMSIDETARLSGFGRSTIYEHLTGAREPKLPSFKVGKRRLVLREDHAAWLRKFPKG